MSTGEIIGTMVGMVFGGILFIGLPIFLILGGGWGKEEWKKREQARQGGIAAGLVLIPIYLFILTVFFSSSISLVLIICGIVLFFVMIGIVLTRNIIIMWCLLPIIGVGYCAIYSEITGNEELTYYALLIASGIIVFPFLIAAAPLIIRIFEILLVTPWNFVVAWFVAGEAYIDWIRSIIKRVLKE